MRIERLELENFRLFEKQVFHFPALFTVLIGENGRGKSALLHGLRVAAGAWLLGFRETERLHIEKEDVRRVELARRFAPQFPVTVKANGIVEGQHIEWMRQQRSEYNRGLKGEAEELLKLAHYSEDRTNNQLLEIELPVLVYFSTARLRVEAKKPVELKTKGSKIEDGYVQALTPEYKRKGTPSRTIALSWIRTTHIQVTEDKVQALTRAFEHLVRPQKDRDFEGAYRAPFVSILLDAVTQAITTCIPDWTELRWDSENDDLSGLYHRPDAPPERVPLYYLSDGLRTMAGMVAEIAYRCVTLNGHLGQDAVTGSKGLVLIDELDMHLHPNWQRRVVGDLKKAFPNLQFVVTTHSPFIVQSLDTDEIISLDYDDLGEQSPKELPVGEVAVDFMNVESELSKEGEENQGAADKHLSVLLTAKDVAAGHIDAVTSKKLEELEESVSDISLRMTLRMERILREHPASKPADETN